jgi:hypothetical protein
MKTPSYVLVVHAMTSKTNSVLCQGREQMCGPNSQ